MLIRDIRGCFCFGFRYERAFEVEPRVPIAIRVATMEDLPFMDALQKKHSKALGYFPRKQFEGYVEQQAVSHCGGRCGIGRMRNAE